MANEKRLINANALIHRLVVDRDEVEIKTGCDIGYHNGLNMAVSMAINAPTVDAVEVVHGRWKNKQTNSIFTWRLECSVCGVDYHTPVVYNYCPNCGAKMDGERKDNE